MKRGTRLLVGLLGLITALQLFHSYVTFTRHAAETADAHPAELRNDITSPGGTTAAAMYTAERGNFRTVIADAVWAAYHRSVVVGGGERPRHPGLD